MAERKDLPALIQTLTSQNAVLVRIDLPAGETLKAPPSHVRRAGRFARDPAEELGVQPGDLYVVINTRPHPVFARREADVYVETKIGIAEATLGADSRVPTLYGDVELTIPSGTQPGTIFKIKGKGLPRPNSWGKGDEFVKMNVVVPRGLSSRQRELLKKFGEEEEKG